MARAALEVYDVDELGLDRLDRAVLTALVRSFGGGPVGVATLAVAVGEETTTVEEVCEPYLVRAGMLARTPRGRIATAAAWTHLGLPPPPDAVGRRRVATGGRVVFSRPGTLGTGRRHALLRKAPGRRHTDRRIMNFSSLLLPLIIVLFAVPLFMGTRKQKRAQQQQQRMQSSLGYGDRVMTTSGLYGRSSARRTTASTSKSRRAS